MKRITALFSNFPLMCVTINVLATSLPLFFASNKDRFIRDKAHREKNR